MPTTTPGATCEIQAAQIIWSHWRDGAVMQSLPQECRPSSRAQGYAIQAQLAQVSGQNVAGWKIAATSAAGQAHINVSGPIAGRLLSGRVHRDGATLSSVGNRMRVAEPEISFALIRPLPARDLAYSVNEVLAAVGEVHPSIELPDSRFETFTTAGEAQLLADNACAHQFILGHASHANWRELDLSRHAVSARVTHADGTQWVRDGSGAAVLGDPRIALTWLVNELRQQGIGLQAGEFVTTGTCMQPLELLPGDQVRADFGALGQVSMRFSP